jgi:hypothetical protein
MGPFDWITGHFCWPIAVACAYFVIPYTTIVHVVFSIAEEKQACTGITKALPITDLFKFLPQDKALFY